MTVHWVPARFCPHATAQLILLRPLHVAIRDNKDVCSITENDIPLGSDGTKKVGEPKRFDDDLVHPGVQRRLKFRFPSVSCATNNS